MQKWRSSALIAILPRPWSDCYTKNGCCKAVHQKFILGGLLHFPSWSNITISLFNFKTLLVLQLFIFLKCITVTWEGEYPTLLQGIFIISSPPRMDLEVDLSTSYYRLNRLG